MSRRHKDASRSSTMWLPSTVSILKCQSSPDNTRKDGPLRIEDIEIHVGDIGRPHRVVGPVKAQVTAATAFSRAPTIDEANAKLREKAIELGANAVMEVEYHRGATLMSWKGLKATGIAVIAE